VSDGAEDDRWMSLAIALARRGRPAPNPHVGAVIASGRTLVSFGWHERAGGPHAERVAIAAAGPRAMGATLYVTLEPCNHFCRTPPCVDAVLGAGFPRVVVGCRDPNRRVAGGGVERLRRAGVDVTVGVRGDAAFAIIAEWAHRERCGA
jgi:diaminohydroxyphosphoribosylaminopyrimidine deaminase/5-amino-6-(5-phosphoribosylamino)uracil reductase